MYIYIYIPEFCARFARALAPIIRVSDVLLFFLVSISVLFQFADFRLGLLFSVGFVRALFVLPRSPQKPREPQGPPPQSPKTPQGYPKRMKSPRESWRRAREGQVPLGNPGGGPGKAQVVGELPESQPRTVEVHLRAPQGPSEEPQGPPETPRERPTTPGSLQGHAQDLHEETCITVAHGAKTLN